VGAYLGATASIVIEGLCCPAPAGPCLEGQKNTSSVRFVCELASNVVVVDSVAKAESDALGRPDTLDLGEPRFRSIRREAEVAYRSYSQHFLQPEQLRLLSGDDTFLSRILPCLASRQSTHKTCTTCRAAWSRTHASRPKKHAWFAARIAQVSLHRPTRSGPKAIFYTA
jgi:hypothetical protein